MFIPGSFGAALALLFLNMICWGSWGNTSKWSSLPFPSYYAVYSVSVCVSSLVLGLILGSDLYGDLDDQHRDFVANMRAASPYSIMYACLSGILFNAANVLLVLLISLVGLATAFPLCIGIALVMGTLLSFVIAPGDTDVTLLMLGVGLAVLALLFMGGAHMLKDKAAAREASTLSLASPLVAQSTTGAETSGVKLSTGATITLSVLCGILMGGFAPLETLAQRDFANATSGPAADHNGSAGNGTPNGTPPAGLMTMARPAIGVGAGGSGEPLIPYTCGFFFCTAAMVSSVPICLLLARLRCDGRPPLESSICGEIVRHRCMDTVQPVVGGFIWCLGTTLNFVVGFRVSQAVAYSLAQAAPLVAALWGVLWFREFKGAPRASWGLLLCMMAAYSGAIVSIALSTTSNK